MNRRKNIYGEASKRRCYPLYHCKLKGRSEGVGAIPFGEQKHLHLDYPKDEGKGQTCNGINCLGPK